MTVEEILQGESKDLEFKEKLPEDSKKYMKTIVAFSNGDGGRLIIGVNDDREVVGVDQTSVFTMIDKITNAISDSCEPLIIPDIAPQAVGDKTVIVVEISAGRQRPYYLKSLGMDKGLLSVQLVLRGLLTDHLSRKCTMRMRIDPLIML
jgi:predicted HTH transcriptional regulator